MAGIAAKSTNDKIVSTLTARLMSLGGTHSAGWIGLMGLGQPQTVDRFASFFSCP